MFDGLFEIIAKALAFFYDLIPNYAVAIALLTLVVMLITTPFTLKGTRSMIQMQRLQPEMRRLQTQHKDDRQKLNEELMAFYKENNLNPLGGCLPLLLQTPIFIILYRVIRGLTNPGKDGTFDPRYVGKTVRATSQSPWASSSGRPLAATKPSITRKAWWAIRKVEAMSWEMTTLVTRKRSRVSSIRSSTIRLVIGSSPLVGSS